MKRFIIVLGIILATVAATLSMLGGKTPEKRPPPQPVIKQLSAQPVVPLKSGISLSYYGLIKARNRATISSEISGQILAKDFRLREGQQITRGQRLFQIDDRQARLQESHLKSQLLTTLTRFLPEIQQQYPQEYEKWQQFFSVISNTSSGLGFQIKFPKLSEQREEILAHSMGVSSQFYTYQQQSVVVDKHALEAPFSGSIIDAKASVGSPVAPGSMLAQLVGRVSYEMNLQVPVEVIPFLKVRSDARVKVEGHNLTLPAKIIRIARAMDANTQTVPVILLIQSSHAILDGRYGEASIVTSQMPAVFQLSAESLAADDRVFFIQGGQLYDRQVNVILRDPEFVYLSMENFKEGEMVVNEMFQEYFPGMQVKIRPSREPQSALSDSAKVIPSSLKEGSQTSESLTSPASEDR